MAQRRNTVVALDAFFFGLAAFDVEDDEAGVLGEFDAVEFVRGLVDGGGEVFEAFDRAAVDFLDDFVAEVFVADGVGSGENAADENDFAAVGGEFALEAVEVDEAQGGFA